MREPLREHDTDSLGCACGPRFYVPCEDCENGAGCWKCRRGLIEVTRAEADATVDRVVLVIVHEAP